MQRIPKAAPLPTLSEGKNCPEKPTTDVGRGRCLTVAGGEKRKREKKSVPLQSPSCLPPCDGCGSVIWGDGAGPGGHLNSRLVCVAL